MIKVPIDMKTTSSTIDQPRDGKKHWQALSILRHTCSSCKFLLFTLKHTDRKASHVLQNTLGDVYRPIPYHIWIQDVAIHAILSASRIKQENVPRLAHTFAFPLRKRVERQAF